MSRLRVFIASSLDGFIAGENDDLSWLTGPSSETAGASPSDYGYDTFIAECGALLMGRNTYRVVEAFSGWPYGELPVLVATSRPLTPKVDTVRAVSGTIEELVAEAKRVAGDKDVYLDGGVMIRQALDADLVDELIVSILPIAIGKGAPLFAGVGRWQRFDLVGSHAYPSGLVQLTLKPRR